MREFRSLMFVTIMVVLGSCSTNENKIGVVDLPQVYSSFDYQKELMNEFDKVSVGIDAEKDSLDQSIYSTELLIGAAANFSTEEKNVLFENSYVAYLADKEYLEYRRDSIASAYSGKIWKQLNSYIESYGVDNDYSVIIGMQGNGNIMYVKDQVNITEDVVGYVNQKYNGE